MSRHSICFVAHAVVACLLTFFSPAASAQCPVVTSLTPSQEICPGQTVNLSVAAQNLFLISWYREGSPFAVGFDTAISVTPTATTQYYARITSPWSCTIETQRVTITVRQPTPTITQQPPAQPQVCGILQMQISVAATSATSYQWYWNATPISPSDPQFSNAQTATLQINTPAIPFGSGFRCLVNGCAGSVFSNQCVPVPLPDMVISQPLPQTTAICTTNGSAVLHVAAQNGFGYEWRVNGAVLGQNDPVYHGQSTDTLTITGLSNGVGTVISCGVINCFGGRVPTQTTLVAASAPAITADPQSVATCPGQPVQFSAAAQGVGGLSYAWTRNNLPISDPRFAGAQGPTLSFVVQPGDFNVPFVCRVTSCSGIATSQSAYVTSVPSLSPSGPVILCAGGGLAGPGYRVSVSPGLDPAPQGLIYQWRINGQILAGESGPEIYLADRFYRSTDVIDCTLTGYCDLNAPYVFPTTLLHYGQQDGSGVIARTPSLTVAIGGTAELAADAYMITQFHAGQYWSKDGQLIPLEGRFTSVPTPSGRTLRITNVQPGDAGAYTLAGLYFANCWNASEPMILTVVAGCGPADVGGQGGIAGPDSHLDNNDFIVFINFFFSGDARADFGTQGGLRGSDGAFDNNDFIAFINAFFAGCP